MNTNQNRLKYNRCNINVQNKNGDTPLLTHLKLALSKQYLEYLLSIGASVTITNNENISPLSYAIARRIDYAGILLEKGEDAQFMYETPLKTELYQARDIMECEFITFAINTGLEAQTLLVCFFSEDPLYMNNLTFVELSDFLSKIDASISDHSFNEICAALIRDSLKHSNTEAVFKTVWNRAHHIHIAKIEPILPFDFCFICDFVNSQFIECLKLVLTSPYASYFNYTEAFYGILLLQFSQSNVDRLDRMAIISYSVRLVKVTIDDIMRTYDYYGFNEEVIMLIRHFKPTIDNSDCFQIVKFIEMLEVNDMFSINNISKLDLVRRQSYRKLIFSVPEQLLNEIDSIKLKKQILHRIPTLFEMCACVVRDHLQTDCRIRDCNRFATAVESLPVPKIIKNVLCDNRFT
ncbi:hypothetical protein ILUMI_13416 [Ignelater luminosus]|uniref:SOCS box domain-containing protein n=1 Tax=Ignelater luminosus TaxID=2038154 RepID=A0A8K0CXU2_IGNLU|nr:hypothetical protein ILUMI_13416 [Ignelater luminosus]